ncbi:hypothetical protein V8E52_012002 [Russula decolorans]
MSFRLHVLRVSGLLVLYIAQRLDWERVKKLGGKFLQLQLEDLARRYHDTMGLRVGRREFGPSARLSRAVLWPDLRMLCGILSVGGKASSSMFQQSVSVGQEWEVRMSKAREGVNE